MSIPRDFSYVATILDLDSSAVERFLNAAAYLCLARKIDGLFIHATPSVNYDDEHAKLLLWLINSKFPDFVECNKITMTDVINDFDKDITEKVTNSIKCSLLRMDGNYIANSLDIKSFMLSGSSSYIGPKICHFEKIFTAEILESALKTSQSQWGRSYGFNVTNPFEMYVKDRKLLTDFMLGMRKITLLENKILADQLDLSNTRSILDIGGGTGDWSILLLEHANAECTVDIYERSDAIPVLLDIFKQNANENAQSRIRYVEGSFLDDANGEYLTSIPKNKVYDLISLGWVLHDWNDDTCAMILRKAYSHLPPGGDLIILEAIMPEDKVSEIALSDITMLLHTEGKERSFSEYKKILQRSGFISENILWTESSTRRQVISARK